MRHYGPGDIATWPEHIRPGDPRFDLPEPPHSEIDTQIEVLAGKSTCDELGRDFDDLMSSLYGVVFDPCEQSRKEVAALVASFPELAPTAHKHMRDQLEQAQ